MNTPTYFKQKLLEILGSLLSHLKTSWWFQPIWKILVKWKSSPNRDEHKKCLKPPHRKSINPPTPKNHSMGPTSKSTSKNSLEHNDMACLCMPFVPQGRRLHWKNSRSSCKLTCRWLETPPFSMVFTRKDSGIFHGDMLLLPKGRGWFSSWGSFIGDHSASNQPLSFAELKCWLLIVANI